MQILCSGPYTAEKGWIGKSIPRGQRDIQFTQILQYVKLIIDGLSISHLYNNIMILCIDEQALWRRLQKTYSMLVNTVENDGLAELCDVELCELTKIVCFMTRFG